MKPHYWHKESETLSIQLSLHVQAVPAWRVPFFQSLCLQKKA